MAKNHQGCPEVAKIGGGTIFWKFFEKIIMKNCWKNYGNFRKILENYPNFSKIFGNF
jgi:hypothetical protein